MALNLGGGGLFGPASQFGVSSTEARAASVIVAKDGSGDTDDVQEGINLLPPGGGMCLVKEGVYDIKDELTFAFDNQILRGVGPGTILQTTTNIRMFFIDNKDDCRIENLKIVGTGTGNNNNTGIEIQNSTGFEVRNCIITNCGGGGIQAASVTIKVLNCSVVSNIDSGIFIQGSNSIVTNCIVNQNSEHGIELFGADNCIVTNNRVETNVKHGIILFTSDENNLSDNFIAGNDSGNLQTYDGIHLDNSDRNIITNNRCWDNDNYEIELANNTCDQNILIGNILLGSDHVGTINDQGTNTHPNGASGTNNLAFDDLNIIA